ncbi:helix-turn-helix transcriptional regulator [Thermodesulfobacteriota bacterium]
MDELKGKRLLNINETARFLGISPRSIYNQLARNAKRRFPIKPVRHGGSIRFDINDLNEYIDLLKSKSNPNEKKVKLMRRR